MNDTGTMSCVAADPAEFKLLGSAEVLAKGHEAWGPMAIAGGKMLVRDLTRMVCLDLSETGHE
jgi:outer membrane protein assembly factor BamB